MKSILGIVLGSVIGWIIAGYLMGDFSVERVERYSMLLMGIILGYFIGRRNPKQEAK